MELVYHEEMAEGEQFRTRNGDPVHDLTQGDANYLLSVFAEALVASEVVGNIDTSLLEAKAKEAEEKKDEDDDDDDDDEFGDGHVDYLEHDLDLMEAELVTNSDGSQELRMPESKMSVSSSSSSFEVVSKPAYMARMPAHLKPAMIDTSPRDGDSVEKTTEGILAMLHTLKNTPSPKYADDKAEGTGKKYERERLTPTSKNPQEGHRGNKAKRNRDLVI